MDVLTAPASARRVGHAPQRAQRSRAVLGSSPESVSSQPCPLTGTGFADRRGWHPVETQAISHPCPAPASKTRTAPSAQRSNHQLSDVHPAPFSKVPGRARARLWSSAGACGTRSQAGPRLFPRTAPKIAGRPGQGLARSVKKSGPPSAATTDHPSHSSSSPAVDSGSSCRLAARPPARSGGQASMRSDRALALAAASASPRIPTIFRVIKCRQNRVQPSPGPKPPRRENQGAHRPAGAAWEGVSPEGSDLVPVQPPRGEPSLRRGRPEG